MNYPLISEYVVAIKATEDNFEQLKNLCPVLGEDGEPVMTSGNFAVVFKMKDEQTGKLHAVKCFLKEQEGRAEAYRMIAEELEYVNSTFLTPIKYLDKELFVDSKNSDETEFPVLLMDWVEGQTLDKYIREHIYDQYELSLLAYQFSRLAMWLMPQPFAHGDLKPDNILVKDDGTLVLVDYDGMYVPAMKGQKARELGSPDFRHPSRTENDFDEHIDDFSLASILLSLKAISLQSSLLEEYGASDRLLFSEKDYRNLSESRVMDALKPLMQDAELASLYSLYILALSQNNLSQVSFRLFNLNRPDKSQYEEENLSTEVTEEDLANAWTDEYGVKYSKDRKRLLKAPIHLKEYSIRKGTLVICDFAFTEFDFIKVNDNRKSELSSLLLPIGIKAIGRGAFIWCEELKELTIPNTVIFIGDAAFYNCFRLCNISIPSSLTRIEDEMFVSCQISRLSLPLSIKAIGNRAFWNCSLSDITIPNSVTTIEEGAFSGCPLSSVIIPNSITKIEDETFYECFNLKRVILPNSVTEIGNLSFYSCAFAEIELPNSIVRIGYHAFNYCESLKQIDIPDSVEVIEEGAFANCYSLESVRLPKSIKELGFSLFNECDELKHIIIPIGTKKKFEKLLPEHIYKLAEKDEDGNYSTEVTDKDLSNAWVDEYGVKYSVDRKRLLGAPENLRNYSVIDGTEVICKYAFRGCSMLINILIPDSVKSVGQCAFLDCSRLASISIPTGVTRIEEWAFQNPAFNSWYNKQPKGLVYVGKVAYSYKGDMLPNTSLVLKDGTSSIGIAAFVNCRGLTSIIIPQSTTCIEKVAFQGCSGLTSVTIPNNVTSIGLCAFQNCSSLSSIIIPNNVASIGDQAFNNCSNLTSVTISNKVTKIGFRTFGGCSKLISVTISNSVTSIDENAFEGCSVLSSIIIPVGTKRKFEKLMPAYKSKLVELSI